MIYSRKPEFSPERFRHSSCRHFPRHDSPRNSQKIRQIELRTKCELILALVLTAYFSASAYQYIVPEKTNDGWEIASLADAKLDAGLFNEMFESLSSHAKAQRGQAATKTIAAKEHKERKD